MRPAEILQAWLGLALVAGGAAAFDWRAGCLVAGVGLLAFAVWRRA